MFIDKYNSRINKTKLMKVTCQIIIFPYKSACNNFFPDKDLDHYRDIGERRPYTELCKLNMFDCIYIQLRTIPINQKLASS